jgi:nitrogen fixation-related uncharacterized protein
MIVVYTVIGIFVVVFGVSAVWGLVWAIRTGQMSNFAQGAESIFDDEEPIGEMTDRFPDADRSAPPSDDENDAQRAGATL